MSNRIAATEEEIGKIHKSITLCHNLKLDAILRIAEEYQKMGADAALLELINLKDLSVPQKWVEYNGVAAVAASENGETELGRKLRKLKEAQKGKVVQFRDTGSE